MGYLANEWSVLKLLGIFATGCGIILAITLALVKGHNPNLRSTEKATILWFVLCELGTPWGEEWHLLTHYFIVAGTIHLFFEGRTFFYMQERLGG